MNKSRKRISTKNMTKTQRVAKVKQALKKFVAWDSEHPLKVQKAVAIGDYGDKTFLYLGRGAFTSRGWHVHSFEGVVSGYNMNVFEAVQGLGEVRVLSNADVEAFYEWFRDERRISEVEAEIENARMIAEKHGYTLSKRPKPKRTAA